MARTFSRSGDKLRKALTDVAQQAASSVARRPSLGGKKLFDGSPSSPSKAEEEGALQLNWSGQLQDVDKFSVGCRYEVGKAPLKVFSGPDVKGEPIGEVVAKEQVMLGGLRELDWPGHLVGLIIPKPPHEPGWAVIEAPWASTPPLLKRSLPDSWEVGARYCVMSGATLRKGTHLNTQHVGEVDPGEEVLALELGANEGEDVRLRLRMMVKTGSGMVGWMSPETANGDTLLNRVDLLNANVLELQKSPSSGRLRFSMLAAGGDARHSSYKLGAPLTWEVRGQYRVLEKVSMRLDKWLDGKEIGKLSAGSVVSVKELHLCECWLGWCPCALVTVEEGPEKGSSGWIRCSAKDGHDLIDTRDQQEHHKVKDVILQMGKAGARGRGPRSKGQPGCMSGCFSQLGCLFRMGKDPAAEQLL